MYILPHFFCLYDNKMVYLSYQLLLLALMKLCRNFLINKNKQIPSYSLNYVYG